MFNFQKYEIVALARKEGFRNETLEKVLCLECYVCMFHKLKGKGTKKTDSFLFGKSMKQQLQYGQNPFPCHQICLLQ